MIRENAYAKINLSLDVTGLLPGGYHAVRGVMQGTDFADTITVEPGAEEWRAESNLRFLPTGGANLAVRAAIAFRAATGLGPEGGVIRLEKHIPVCGGLGGGSSNAAAVLRALNREYAAGLDEAALCRLAAGIGSDVPFCIRGGTMLAEGRGEILTPLPPLPDCGIVICRPGFSSSTPELFAAVDRLRIKMHPDTDGMISALEARDLDGVARRMFNIFEAVLPRRHGGLVHETKEALLDEGALGACMSGTGSAVFGLFETPEQAREACLSLRESGMQCYLCRPR